MANLLRRLLGLGPSRRAVAPEEDPRTVLRRRLGALERELEEAAESAHAVAAVRADLEERREQAKRLVGRHAGQAERALALEREDLARRALASRREAEGRLRSLEESIAEVGRQQAALERARADLQRKLDGWRTRQLEMGARLTAAEAEIQLRQVAGEAAGDAGTADRARERVEAARLDSLGPLSALPEDEDRVEMEIRRLERARRIESELERLRLEARGEETQGGEGKEPS